MSHVDVFAFSSANLTNVWAGVGAGLWAVGKEQSEKVGGAAKKAAALQIGSLGIIYCSAIESFTTPFIVYSRPDPEKEISDVWREKWVLPFRIHPLGTPRRLVHKDKLRSLLPSLQDGKQAWNQFVHVAPTTIFAASRLQSADWEALLRELAE